MDEKVFELIEKMYGEFASFRKEMQDFREETGKRFDSLEKEQNKQGIILEKIQKDMQLISEIVQSGQDVNEREHKEIKSEANERFVVIEGVLKTKK